MSTTPTIVREAFAPVLEHQLDLAAVLVLEAVGCRYLTGGVPGLRDAVLVWLAMTDLPALKQARSGGRLDDHLEAWAAGRRPADLLGLQESITAAVTAAFAPAGEASPDEADPLEKKGQAVAAGG